MRDWPPKAMPGYRRAVFLDRDGTVNVDSDYPHLVESLAFIAEAIDGLKLLATLPLDIIVISNQSGIALGIFTRQQMSRFNDELRCRVEKNGGRIDAFYFCPHLEPRMQRPGSVLCVCSKPSPGMLKEAGNDFQIDLTKSFLVGDKTSDIAAGQSVGCVTILVKTGKSGKEEGALPVEPKYVAENLHEAARTIRSFVEYEASD